MFEHAIEFAPGAYPERPAPDESALDLWWQRLRSHRPAPARALSRQHKSFLKQLTDSAPGTANQSLDTLASQARALGVQKPELHSDAMVSLLALLRECAALTLGMRPFDTQMVGAQVLLAGGIAEMPTGEGKTLTATLPAAAVALGGVPVHVLTVNDYLADRDATAMRPFFEALGLTVGTVTSSSTEQQRRAAYACDVTYATCNQVVFDYLRDRLTLQATGTGLRLRIDALRGRRARHDTLMLRGLGYAIVDEADSVFVDEARTPLILSDQERNAALEQATDNALMLARQLNKDDDFRVRERRRQIELTRRGEDRLDALARPLGGFWCAAPYREELARMALSALWLFHKDEHYLVRDGGIFIVDEHTGRIMPGRTWSRGLHQMIEAKEQCEITPQRDTLAQLTYQRFFRRYIKLAGMTGTALEVRRELWQVYRTRVQPIPPHRPSQRARLADQVFAALEEKWAAVIERVTECRAQGRPVLVGVRTVGASEALSARLTESGVPHHVLNARQDAGEAELVARAGQRGAVTVATNMAGRGTDIVLGPGVAELGGLHVIVTERHEAARIDRQLLGRAARQGDPGSGEMILSLADPLVARERGWRRALVNVARRAPGSPVARAVLKNAQRRVQSLHSKMRRDLVRDDEQRERQLAFSGHGE